VVMGILAGSQTGYAASMFYVITYAIIAMGGFAVVILLSRDGEEADQLADLKGLSSRHPWYAFMMMLFLFAMAGVPPTVGFYAKLSVINAVVDAQGANLVWLAVFAVVMSVVGAYYYLRAIKLMYFDEPDNINPNNNNLENSTSQSALDISVPIKPSWDFSVLLSVNGLAVLVLGILPGALMALCVWAIQTSL